MYSPMKDKEYKVYQFHNNYKQVVEVDSSIMWDYAYRFFISHVSEGNEYYGKGISYEKEVAIMAALTDFNMKAPDYIRITRQNINI